MNPLPFARSIELLSAPTSALLIVDMQARILTPIEDRDRLVGSLVKLVSAASLVDVPLSATEQYPEGLGPTVAELHDRLPPPTPNCAFSVRPCENLWRNWSEQGRSQIVVAGIETHVCILQSAFDLLAAGFQVHVPVDGVAARGKLDHETALRRLESSAAPL